MKKHLDDKKKKLEEDWHREQERERQKSRRKAKREEAERQERLRRARDWQPGDQLEMEEEIPEREFENRQRLQVNQILSIAEKLMTTNIEMGLGNNCFGNNAPDIRCTSSTESQILQTDYKDLSEQPMTKENLYDKRTEEFIRSKLRRTV